jgi:phenylalanyl-tRNA synthetase beta chain
VLSCCGAARRADFALAKSWVNAGGRAKKIFVRREVFNAVKVTYNWLKDFVDIRLTPKALADTLTMAGLEVESLEERDGEHVFEIEITSNRPDWLSVMGIAREIAAITGKKLKSGYPTNTEQHTPHTKHQGLQIHIEEKKDCPLYTAKILRDVKVGASPDWLKKRLELIGCRSVNNVVDSTNYILFTWGEPLHAFDLDKLHDTAIVVRRAGKDETLLTIDGHQRPLTPEILVIADTQKVVALAGIMGGKDTEVTGTTKNILLEAAVFNPIVIRRGRQQLGIQTDSSYRFERGTVPEIAEAASKEAVRLLSEMCGGNCVAATHAGTVKTKDKTVIFEAAHVSRILGVSIPELKIKKILTGLGFNLKRSKGNALAVKVPVYRRDVSSEIDLVEEIARIFGYDNIPVSQPSLHPAVSIAPVRSLVATIKHMLVGLGLHEVITYSLIDRGMLKGLEERYPGPLEILNPLSREQEILRPTLIPSLLKCVAHNLNQKQEQVGIFEIAAVFSSVDKAAPKERLVVGIALCGVRVLLLEQGAVKDELGILHLKGIVEVVCGRLGVKNWNLSAPDASGEISVMAGGEKIGAMYMVQENSLDAFDIKNKKVVAAELYVDALLSRADLMKKFTRLPAYPGITRDISLVVKEEIKAEDILAAIKEHGGTLLREVKIVDYYKGAQIPAGFKGMTISCFYRSDERTLTEAEITPVQATICEALLKKLDAKIR